MRTLLVSALVLLAACGGSDDRASQHEAPSAPRSQGPDAVIVRVPRTGGVARAYVYPRLDSVVWRSASPAPAVATALAFDADAGLLAFVDAKGRPGRLDLRAGGVNVTAKPVLASLASADGNAIYGLDKGAVTRLTPAGGGWPFKPPAGVRDVVPLTDGSVILVTPGRDSALLWRVRPPDTRLLDTVSVPAAGALEVRRLGDRVYLVADSLLYAVRSRDLAVAPHFTFPGHIVAIAATPSGDRVYVALDGDSALQVVDRYRDVVAASVQLPSPARAVRVDALGRYVLVRGAGDSAHVIAVGTDRLIGSVETAWRDDLPLVLPDGRIALARGKDVVLVDGETLAERDAVRGGAADSWHLVLWNGFRPRAKGLDEPVTFATDTESRDTSAIDSSAFAGAVITPDSVAPPAPATPATPAPARPAPPAQQGPAFTLSFAALRDEAAARDLAGEITIEGEHARVVPSTVAGTPVFRVVMGPYRSKAEAERRGRAAGRDYWVYAGTP